jgi:hypothetical protein
MARANGSSKLSSSAIQEMLDIMNEDYPPIQAHWLRQFAQSWIRARYLTKQWDQQEEFLKVINEARVDLFQIPGEAPIAIPLLIIDGDDGQAWQESDACRLAAKRFLDFITSPYYNEIKTCDRCNQFFIKIGKYRNKSYCSRTCHNRETAAKATQQRRERQRTEKLSRLRDAIFSLRAAANQRPQILPQWKAWVCERAGVNQRFLTRTLNSGELTVPNWIPPRHR